VQVAVHALDVVAGECPHRLERGGYAAVLSAGAGFTWSAVVVQRT